MGDDPILPCPALPGRTAFGGMMGESAPMRRLHQMIAKARQNSAPALLLGETGTGKEPVAQAIHFEGLRREKAFVPVDCSALTSTPAQTELFGHVRDAFAGVYHAKRDLLEAANEGTLFLDEIGESLKLRCP